MKWFSLGNKKISIVLAICISVLPITAPILHAEDTNDDSVVVPDVPDSNKNSNLVTDIPTSPAPGTDNGGGGEEPKPSSTTTNDGGDSNGDGTSDVTKPSDDSNNSGNTNTENTNVVTPSTNNNSGPISNNNNRRPSNNSQGTANRNGSQTSNTVNKSLDGSIDLTMLDGSVKHFEIISEIPDSLIPYGYGKIVRNDSNSDSYTILSLEQNLPLPSNLVYLKDTDGNMNLYAVDFDNSTAILYKDAKVYKLGNKRFIISQFLPGMKMPYPYKLINVDDNGNKFSLIYFSRIPLQDIASETGDTDNLNDMLKSALDLDKDEYKFSELPASLNKTEQTNETLAYLFAYPIIDSNLSLDSLDLSNNEDSLDTSSNNDVSWDDLASLEGNIVFANPKLFKVDLSKSNLELDELESINYPSFFINRNVIGTELINQSTSEANKDLYITDIDDSSKRAEIITGINDLKSAIELDSLSLLTGSNNTAVTIGSSNSDEDSENNSFDNSDAIANDGKVTISPIERETITLEMPSSDLANTADTKLQHNNSTEVNANRSSQVENRDSEVSSSIVTQVSSSANVVGAINNSEYPSTKNDRNINNSRLSGMLYFMDKYMTQILFALLIIILALIGVIIIQRIRHRRYEELQERNRLEEEQYAMRRVDSRNLYNPYLDKKEAKTSFNEDEYRSSGVRTSSFKNRARLENGIVSDRKDDDFDLDALVDAYYNGYDKDEKK